MMYAVADGNAAATRWHTKGDAAATRWHTIGDAATKASGRGGSEWRFPNKQ